MEKSSGRPPDEDEIKNVIQNYSNTLYRLCLVMLGNESDAEDVVQETFIKFFLKSHSFSDKEHEKAWLITVATNQARDLLRYRKKHPQIDPDVLEDVPCESPETEILEALMALPEKYRTVLTLYYVEEYRVEDIAKIITKTPSAVKMRLQKGRKLLDEVYRREYL